MKSVKDSKDTPSPRYSFHMHTDGKEIFIMGGCLSFSEFKDPACQQDVITFIPETMSYKFKSKLQMATRHSSSVHLGEKVLIIGGYTKTHLPNDLIIQMTLPN